MADNYRIKYKNGDFEIEVESSDKTFVEDKLNEFLTKDATSIKTKKVKNSDDKKTHKKPSESKLETEAEIENEDSEVDVVKIVNAIYDSENHDVIEEKILKKSNQLNRILLVFYFVHEVYGNNTSINSGDIEKITDQLGVRIQQPNAARKIKANSKFFAGDSVRKKGSVVNYKINRKGLEEYSKIFSN